MPVDDTGKFAARAPEEKSQEGQRVGQEIVSAVQVALEPGPNLALVGRGIEPAIPSPKTGPKEKRLFQDPESLPL